MNLRGGWALIKSTWLSWMQYRGFFFILAFGWMLPPLVALFAWTAAAGDGSLGGLTRAGFAGYYLVLVLVNQFTFAQANWTLGDVIREGSLNFWLLKPMPAIYNVLSAEVAGKTVTLAFLVPVVAGLSLVLRPNIEADGLHILLFIPVLLMAWGLRFLWGCWLAMLAFWSSRADALLALQDALVFLLAGIAAPVSLLPGALQVAARWLPFRYMVSFPVEVLTQNLTPAQILSGMAAQAGWLAAALLLTVILWRVGLRRYSAIGG